MYTVKKHLESYGTIFIGPDGQEHDTPWTTDDIAKARRVARYWNCYVKDIGDDYNA